MVMSTALFRPIDEVSYARFNVTPASPPERRTDWRFDAPPQQASHHRAEEEVQQQGEDDRDEELPSEIQRVEQCERGKDGGLDRPPTRAGDPPTHSDFVKVRNSDLPLHEINRGTKRCRTGRKLE